MRDAGFAWGKRTGLLWGRLRCGYPSHIRPVSWQRLQLGFPSSHFTRRILILVSFQIDEKSSIASIAVTGQSVD
jgi:hypothetical protein